MPLGSAPHQGQNDGSFSASSNARSTGSKAGSKGKGRQAVGKGKKRKSHDSEEEDDMDDDEDGEGDELDREEEDEMKPMIRGGGYPQGPYQQPVNIHQGHSKPMSYPGPVSHQGGYPMLPQYSVGEPYNHSNVRSSYDDDFASRNGFPAVRQKLSELEHDRLRQKDKMEADLRRKGIPYDVNRRPGPDMLNQYSQQAQYNSQQFIYRAGVGAASAGRNLHNPYNGHNMQQALPYAHPQNGYGGPMPTNSGYSSSYERGDPYGGPPRLAGTGNRSLISPPLIMGMTRNPSQYSNGSNGGPNGYITSDSNSPSTALNGMLV